MITAVLDTNVIVGAAIGSKQAAAGRILDAYFDGKYQLAFSPRDASGNVVDSLGDGNERMETDEPSGIRCYNETNSMTILLVENPL